MLERKFMARWTRDRLAKNQGEYWLRIPDSAEGTKPFDGVLWLDNGCAIAIEFKVWRLKRPFDYSCVKLHQMRELLRFQEGESRVSWVVVYYERSKKVRVFYPDSDLMKRMLRDR